MKKWYAILICFVALLLDQASKYWMMQHLMAYRPRPIFPMLNFTLAFNSGSAFSFLSKAGAWHHWFFVVFGISMSIFLCVWLARLPRHARLEMISVSLILSGAIGNLIDRLRFGHVVDFIQVYYKAFYWPVFNVADSCICLGAFLLFLSWARETRVVSKGSKASSR